MNGAPTLPRPSKLRTERACSILGGRRGSSPSSPPHASNASHSDKAISVDAPAEAERDRSATGSIGVRAGGDDTPPPPDATERMALSKLAGVLRSNVVEVREENIFAQNIVDDDALETEGVDSNQIKQIWKLVTEGANNVLLTGLSCLMLISNLMAFRNTDAPVVSGVMFGTMVWTSMTAVPMLVNHRLHVRPNRDPGSAAASISTASTKTDCVSQSVDRERDEEDTWGHGQIQRSRIVHSARSFRDSVDTQTWGAQRTQCEEEPHTPSARLSTERRASAGLRAWAGTLAQGGARPPNWRDAQQKGPGWTSPNRRRARPGAARALWDLGKEVLQVIQQTLFRIYDSPVYWVGRTCRSLAWCVLYVWTTYFLTERDLETGYWDFSQVPSGFHVVIQISIWTTFLDYVFETYSGGGLAFVLSFASLTMLVTMPIFFLLLGWEEIFPDATERLQGLHDVTPWRHIQMTADVRPKFFLLQYGWLRFIELYRVNTMTLAKVRVTSVGIQAASLGVGILCILLTMAGSVHSFEAPVESKEQFYAFDHFFYFSLVTVTTVGYGDFFPTRGLSRAATMAGIIIAVTWVPVQLARLQQALAQNRKQFGTPPDRSEQYVLLCGHVSKTQLQIFFRQVSAHKIMNPARFVVLSNAELRDLEIFSLSRDAQRRLYFEETDILKSLALGTSSHKLLLRNASAVYVFNRERIVREAGAEGDEDQQTTIRVLTLLTFVRPRHMCVQLQSLHNAPMLRTLGIQNLLCLNEIKMRWLGKSVTDCQGIITLMANLLHTAAEVRKESQVDGISEFQREYLDGASCELFVYKLPAWAAKKQAHLLYDAMARVDGLILLAVKDDDLMHIWRGDFTVEEGMMGVWIARTFEQLQTFCERSHAPPWLVPLVRSTGSGGSIVISSSVRCRLSRGESADGPHDTAGQRTSQAGVGAGRGVCSTARTQPVPGQCSDKRIGVQAASSFQPGPQVRPTQQFLPNCLSQPRAQSSTKMRLASAAISGSMRNATARVTDCHAASQGQRTPCSMKQPNAYFPSVPSRRGYKSCSADRKLAPPAPSKSPQSQRVRTSYTLYQHEYSGVRILLCGWPRNLEKFIEITTRSPDLKIVIFAPVQPDHASRNAMRPYRDKYVFVRGNPLDREELKPFILKPGLHSVIVFNEYLTSRTHANAMDVVVCAANVESMLPPGHPDVQVLVSLNSSSDMRFVDRTSWWPASDDPFHGHVSSPTFASGAAIADEMLYPFMMGWFKLGLIEFCTKLTDSVLDPTEMKLIDLPRQFYGGAKQSTYGEMVAPLMASGLLPIALYRNRAGPSAKYMQPYVLTNPKHSTQLRRSDRVYVLTRSISGRNFTSSVKRLERAARTIQRSYRQRAQDRWARTFWQGKWEESAAGGCHDMHLDRPVGASTSKWKCCRPSGSVVRTDITVDRDCDDGGDNHEVNVSIDSVRQLLSNVHYVREEGASEEQVRDLFSHMCGSVDRKPDTEISPYDQQGNEANGQQRRETNAILNEARLTTGSIQQRYNGAGEWWFPDSPVPGSRGKGRGFADRVQSVHQGASQGQQNPAVLMPVQMSTSMKVDSVDEAVCTSVPSEKEWVKPQI